MNGTKHQLISSEYADCLTATIQICKNVCNNVGYEISVEDARDIMRWLNRKGFHKFKLLDEEYSGIFFNASFNVSKIELNGRIVGFELNMVTDAPFGYQEPVVLDFDMSANIIKGIYNRSDMEGFVYPNMTIVVKQAGDFELRNLAEDRVMIIKNCSAGETITIDYPLITSSLGNSRKTKIQNDFNWVFFRLSSTFKNKSNEITSSLPCSMIIEYLPVAKVGI